MKSVGLMAIGLQKAIECLMQFVDVIGDDIYQITVFGLVPYIFDRIKVRRIGGEPLDAKPWGTGLQQLADGGTMSRQAIAHEDDRTPQVDMDFSHKSYKVCGSGVVVKEFVVQTQPTGPGRASNCRQRSDPIVTIPDSLNWRVSRRSPHPPPQGLQQIATFIEKNQASLPFEALFLAAASSRGSSGRWRLHSARALVGLASVDSIRADEANGARRWDGTARRKVAGSCPAPVAQSTPMARTPNAVCPASVRQRVRSAGELRASVSVPDEVLHAACHRAATHSSTDVPKTHWRLPQRRLPSTSFPARTVGLRFADGSRAPRDFLMVSCIHCSDSPPLFH